MIGSMMVWAGLGLAVGLAVTAQAAEPVPVEKLPATKDLPDPLRFQDGTEVKSRRDWSRRRKEIILQVQAEAYGHLPPAGKVRAEEGTTSQVAGGTERQFVLHMGPRGQVSTHVVLTLPDGPGPFPTIVDGDLCWGRIKPEIVSEVLKRGYALAEFDRTEVVPDKEDRTVGLHKVYPDSDLGAIAGWAWGFHRVIDYLRTLPQVDRSRIVVTGHSRGGKAALLAGALDGRVALTAPNNSGCMGAGCCRFPHDGETVERIVKVFPFWFSPRLAQFVGHEDRLPFDQHSIKALVAPRALLSTEGLGDTWANPEGTQMTYLAARKVFEFLKAPEQIGIVFREGGHGHTPPDWQTLLDFADWRLRGKAPARRFDQLAFK